MTSKKQSITLEQFQQAKDALAQLPAKQPTSMNKREVVVALKPQIIALMKKGYSFGEIAQHLEQSAGIRISAITLKSYVQRTGTGKKSAKADQQTAEARPTV